MARRLDDDDYEDRPRKRRRSDDDDNDVDDRVSSRKRPVARSRGDDDDDDYDDRPGKKKKSSKGLIIGLSVGGGVLLVAGIVVVLLLVLKGGGGGDTQKLIVGTWQMNDAGPFALKVQFTADGQFIEDLALIKMQNKYKVINASTIEVDMVPAGFGDFFKGMPGVPGDLKMPNVKRRIEVRVTQNELSLTEGGLVKRYRRVN